MYLPISYFGLFGNHYQIRPPYRLGHTGAIKPERLDDEVFITHFLCNLSVPEGEWHRLVHRYGDLNRLESHDPLWAIQQITQLILHGYLYAYKVPSPTDCQHIYGQHALTDSNGDQYALAPASILLTHAPPKIQPFSSEQDAADVLKNMDSDEATLADIAKRLGLTPSMRTDTPLSLISQALASGKVMLIHAQAAAHTTHSGRLEAVEAVTEEEMPWTRMPSLGPHELEQEEDEPVCELTMCVLRCAHPERAYQLDVLADGPNLNDQPGLQVISATDKPDTIAVTFSGTCANGNAHCPAIQIGKDGAAETSNQSPFKLTVEPKHTEEKTLGFSDFIKHYMVPSLGAFTHQDYHFTSQGCSEHDSHHALVQAFPEFKWGGSVELGYHYADGSTTKDKNTLDKQGQWQLKSGLAGHIGNEKWDFNLEGKRDNTGEQYFPKLKSFFSDFVEKVEQMSECTLSDQFDAPKETTSGLICFDVGWPRIRLGGDISLQEVRGKNTVDLGGSIKLDMNPLLDINVKSDVITWLERFGDVHGELIKQVRKHAKKGVGTKSIHARAELSAEIVMQGKLTTGLEWTKKPGRKWAANGKGSSSMAIGLEGKAHAESKIFAVHVTVGLELYVKGARTRGEGIGIALDFQASTDQNQPALAGAVTFTGLAVYYTYYARVLVKGKDSDDVDTKRRRGGEDMSSNSSGTSEVEPSLKQKKEKHKVLIEAASWPSKKSSDKTPIALKTIEL